MTAESRYEPVNLFFTVTAPEDGEDSKKCPIIFIHGFYSTHRSWSFLKDKIANKTKRKVYCIDMRNHGKSGYSEFFTLKHIMADIENFMHSQHISKAIFVAHSIGSRPFMALALEKPELVEKLVVEDMAMTEMPGHQKTVKQLQLCTSLCDRFIRNAPVGMSEIDLRKKISSAIRQCFPEIGGSSFDSILSIPLKKDQSGKISWDLNIDVVFRTYNNLDYFHINLSNDPKYFGKSLFLFGENSQLIMEENKDFILKYYPNAQFYVFKGGFHAFHVEFPDLFLEVVSNFILE